MIVKNCLPFKLSISFVDSSGIHRKLVLQKNEQQNLFCFTMAKSVKVDILIDGFLPKKDFKIFNLENYIEMQDKIEIVDQCRRSTYIYT